MKRWTKIALSVCGLVVLVVGVFYFRSRMPLNFQTLNLTGYWRDQSGEKIWVHYVRYNDKSGYFEISEDQVAGLSGAGVDCELSKNQLTYGNDDGPDWHVKAPQRLVSNTKIDLSRFVQDNQGKPLILKRIASPAASIKTRYATSLKIGQVYEKEEDGDFFRLDDARHFSIFRKDVLLDNGDYGVEYISGRYQRKDEKVILGKAKSESFGSLAQAADKGTPTEIVDYEKQGATILLKAYDSLNSIKVLTYADNDLIKHHYRLEHFRRVSNEQMPKDFEAAVKLYQEK